jgi:cytochrome c553
MKNLLKVLGLTLVLSVGANASADLYKKCVACHGVTGEKSALGKSKIIKDLTAKQIATALKGYKDGTYGGPMKALMKGQVAAYSNEQLDSIAEFIGKK